MKQKFENLFAFIIVILFVFNSLSVNSQTRYSDYRNVPTELYKLNSNDTISFAMSEELHQAFIRIEKSQFDSIEIICKSIGIRYRDILENDSLAASHYLALCGGVQVYKTKYDSAVILYRKSISKLNSTNQKALANRYTLLAETYNGLSQPQNTKQVIDTAINIYQQIDDTIGLVNAYMIKGLALYRQKDYPQMTKYINLSEILLKKAGIDEHPLYMNISYLRGFVKLDNEYWADNQTQFVKATEIAQKHFLKALEIARQYYEKDHWKVAKMHNVCGIAARQLKQRDREFFHHNEALRIRLKVYGKNHYVTSISYMNLGNYYNDARMLDSAYYYYKTANTIRRTVLGMKHPKTANSYLKLYRHSNVMKDLESALKYAHYSVVASHPTFNDTTDYFSLPVIGNKRYVALLFKCLEAQERALRRLGIKTNQKIYFEKAIETFAKIDSIILNNRKQTVSLNYDHATLTFRNYIYRNGKLTAYYLYKRFGDHKALDFVLRYNERYKANNLFDATNLHKMRDDKQIEKLLQLRLKKFELQKNDKVTRTETEQLEQKIRLIAYNDSLETLVLQIRKKYSDSPVFAHNTKTPTVKEVQEKISKKTAIILFTISRNEIFTLYIDKKKPRFIVKDLGKIQENIYDLLLLTRNPQIDSKEETFFLQHKLFEFLFTDEEGKDIIGRQVKKLVIVPHSVLWRLPFEMCLYKDAKDKTTYQNAPYLLKKYNISYTPSLKNYLDREETKPKTPPKVLAVAPVYNNFNTNYPTRAFKGLLTSDEETNENLRSNLIRNDRITALPYSENEVQDIAKLYNKTVLLTHDKANKKEIETIDLQKFDIIHIAGHAVSNLQDANFSGIILAAADSISDNVLFGGEIPVLNANPDLLVLSACETSIGKILIGEGVNSLSNTFGSIGARKVIASLWKVSDYETYQLMSYFHALNAKNIKDNYTEKLRKAKLNMLKNKNTAHPFYWSAFTLTQY